MIKETIIEMSLVNQRRDTHDKKWAGKTCAICCLKMVLTFKNKKYSDLEIMDLVRKGLLLDGYINEVGWKHKVLVELAKKYGVNMKFQKLFFYSSEEKLKGLGIINGNILKKRPVIVSVLNKKRNGGHMVVINGLRKNGRAVEGYSILDPDFKDKTAYFVTKDDFINNWRGGLILLKS